MAMPNRGGLDVEAGVVRSAPGREPVARRGVLCQAGRHTAYTETVPVRAAGLS